MAAFFNNMVLSLFVLQGIIMFADEVIFHRQRGLMIRESFGHIVDTGIFFAVVLVPAIFPVTRASLSIYIVLAILSSISITKDEWIHSQECLAGEHWCHAILFLLHGMILISVGLLWYLEPKSTVLKILPFLVFLWGFYQFYYWNQYAKRTK